MNPGLDDVTQQDFEQAEALVIAYLRSSNPELDLRKGTAIRDLLVRPASLIYALESLRWRDTRYRTSISAIAADPSQATTDDINQVLSNFSITAGIGSKASGIATISVSSRRRYVIPAGFVLIAPSGARYIVPTPVTASSSPVAGEVLLRPIGSGGAFDVPMESESEGVGFALDTGVALVPTTTFDGFVAAATASAAAGASDPESAAEVLERLPLALSQRALDSRNAISSVLGLPVADGGPGLTIQALSVQGHGDRTQIRDRDNVFALSVGGRADIWLRSGPNPEILTLTVSGTRVSDGVYDIFIPASDVGGFYACRSVALASDGTLSGSISQLPVLGSLDVAVTRQRSDTALATSHSIRNSIEAAYSAFEDIRLRVSGVDADTETVDFRVELYRDAGVVPAQTFVDADGVRNLRADHLVRSAIYVLTAVNMAVIVRPESDVDVDAMRRAVMDMINSKSFVSRLSESEVAAVIHRYDVVGVASTAFSISATVVGADGAITRLSGREINLAAVTDADNLLAPETCVFCTDMDSVFITLRSEAL